MTHDIEEAWAIGERIIVLKDGEIVLDIRPDAQKLPRAYGEGEKIKKQILRALKGGTGVEK